MSLFGDTISTIRKRFRNWALYNSLDSEVEHLDLDYLNRARQWLEQYRWKWDPLTTIVTLTLDSTLSAQCPADMKTILEVYCDTAGTGKPDIWFYEDHSDPAFRYTKLYTPKTVTGGVTSGGYWTVQFATLANAFLSNPKLKYARFLDDYVGYDEGGAEIVEYSFFPGNLLLRTAQKLFIEDKGLDPNNSSVILKSFTEELRNYEVSIQGNNHVCDFTPKNKFGVPIHVTGYAMDGSTVHSGQSVYTPAQQAGFHGY
jgi:hypothetical protein